MPWSGQGSSRRWRAKRKRVLERDSPDNHASTARCQLQYPDRCLGRATTVHHTIPWTGDPADTPDQYLLAACQPCNHHAGEPTPQPDPEPKPWNP